MFVLYTDGSGYAKGGYAGCGVVLFWDRKGISEKIPTWRIEAAYACGKGTHNVAELKAMLVGMRLMFPKTPVFTHHEQRVVTFDQDFQGKNERLEIVSDSEYALHAVSGKNRANKNQTLIMRCRASAQRWKKVYYRHVRGHTNIKWNERADLLAGIAREACEAHNGKQGFVRFDIYVGGSLWLDMEIPRHPLGFLTLNVPKL